MSLNRSWPWRMLPAMNKVVFDAKYEGNDKHGLALYKNTAYSENHRDWKQSKIILETGYNSPGPTRTHQHRDSIQISFAAHLSAAINVHVHTLLGPFIRNQISRSLHKTRLTYNVRRELPHLYERVCPWLMLDAAYIRCEQSFCIIYKMYIANCIIIVGLKIINHRSWDRKDGWEISSWPALHADIFNVLVVSKIYELFNWLRSYKSG